MPRALYSTDHDSADSKLAELREKRNHGGYYPELGPNGHVVYSEWTCPYCGQTLRNTHATVKVGLHRYGCEDRPHPDQQRLPVTGGGD